MTETDFVIAGFEEKFHTFKGRKIVLHGSRDYAEAIIEHFDKEYHFYGIMSKDHIEDDVFHGLKVLCEEEIPQLDIDMIILTERVKYAEAVYQSIDQTCKEQGVLLYDMYGLNQEQVHTDIDNCRLLSLDEWVELCSTYDLVAFEVMDTLLYPTGCGLRPVFKDLLQKLYECNKKVCFSLRKSVSEEMQLDFLKTADVITGDCNEIIRRRGEDLSFRSLSENNPGKRILYIGSGLINECILPRCYGIDTYRFIKGYFDVFAPSTDADTPLAYDKERKENLLKSIEKADVISFDIFDTLLQRYTLYPEDVFALTELRAAEKGFPAEDFANQRTRAERNTSGENIHGIYGYLQNRYHWDEKIRNRMLALEIETEKMVLHPRTEVVQLLQHALDHQKQVVLTSDMYLTTELLDDLLHYNGIDGYSQIFVSCEYGCGKSDGLYERLKEYVATDGVEERTILHIGDNPQVDGVACEQYGIKFEIIPSPYRMAYDGDWDKSIDCVETLMERCLVGMAVAKVFRDPFRNPNLSEVGMEERLQRLAAGVMGPLTAGYMTWLISKLKELKPDGALFFSRDGWIPARVYREISERLLLPAAIYYYANRHSSFLGCADDFVEASYVIDNGKQAGFTGTDILKNIYGLDSSEIHSQDNNNSIRDMVRKHNERINEIAAEARDGYLKYSAEIGLIPNGTYAVSDFISQGTTQGYLERFLPYTFKGFYFGRYRNAAVNKSSNTIDIQSYLKGENPCLLNNYIELESFFSSPEPAMDHITADGTLVFQEEVRSEKELTEMKMVAEETVSFCRLFFDTFYRENEVIRPIVTEELYAADGHHWVQRTAYDDLFKTVIIKREWEE